MHPEKLFCNTFLSIIDILLLLFDYLVTKILSAHYLLFLFFLLML